MNAMTPQPWSITEHCPVADDGRCELVTSGPFPDPTGLVGPITVARCRRCGVGVTRPPMPDVAPLYADRGSRDFQPATAGLARAIKRIAFRRQAHALLRQIGGAPRGIVDFGCGSGLFTACLAEAAGEGIRVTGTDFHSAAPPDLGAVTYVPMVRQDELKSTADILLALHVLEHDDDPLKLLGRMTALVQPGGRLAIEVPNVDCVWASAFGRYWDWYLPFHRIHFSRASLRALLERGGLAVLAEHDVCVPSLGRTLAQALGQPNGAGFVLLTAALYPLQWLVERLTQRPTALRMVAEKP